MNVLYVIIGVSLALFGLWETLYMAMKIASEGTGILGAKIKLLGLAL
jgi:hypothetical protein